jgi:hypothetical protein
VFKDLRNDYAGTGRVPFPQPDRDSQDSFVYTGTMARRSPLGGPQLTRHPQEHQDYYDQHIREQLQPR